MSFSIPYISSEQSPEQFVAALEEYGVVIIENLLNCDVLNRFNAELDPLLEASQSDRSFINPMIDAFFGNKTRHITGVAARSGVFSREILPHPVYMSLCDQILGPTCASYQLNLAHIMDREPGAVQQLLHRDGDAWCYLPAPRPEISLSSVIALCDFSADNGATRVVPGSHRWPAAREASPGELEVAEMRAGSAVVYLGSTLHAGGTNSTTAEFRRGMHLSYVAGWLRTEENHYLALNIDEVRQLPRRSQELLGYAAHDAISAGGGYLGTVDLISPIDLIAQGRL